MDTKGEKLRLDLLPWDALEEVAKVFMFGAKKHEPNGWKKIPDAIPVYRQATGRHFSSIMQGNDIDEESGLMAEAHACADLLIVIAKRLEERKRSA